MHVTVMAKTHKTTQSAAAEAAQGAVLRSAGTGPVGGGEWKVVWEQCKT